jgi:hypothetical protein
MPYPLFRWTLRALIEAAAESSARIRCDRSMLVALPISVRQGAQLLQATTWYAIGLVSLENIFLAVKSFICLFTD